MQLYRFFLLSIGMMALSITLWSQPYTLITDFPIHIIGHEKEEEFNNKGEGKLIRPFILSFGEGGWDAVQVVYEGSFYNSKANGYGKLTATAYFLSDGISEVFETYIGNFVDGYPDGLGTAHFHKRAYHGNFKKGLYDGDGIYYTSDGNIYRGVFANGALNGYATITNKFSEIISSGTFQNGQPHGQIITTYPDGIIKISSYKEGECGGMAISISTDGKICEEPCHIYRPSCFE